MKTNTIWYVVCTLNVANFLVKILLVICCIGAYHTATYLVYVIRLSKIDHLVTECTHSGIKASLSLRKSSKFVVESPVAAALLATLCHCIFTVSFDREFILYCIGTPHIKCIRILQHLLFTHTFKITYTRRRIQILV